MGQFMPDYPQCLSTHHISYFLFSIHWRHRYLKLQTPFIYNKSDDSHLQSQQLTIKEDRNITNTH